MKKRRELDALVGGVKPRRKTSNFSKSSTGSSHELLRYNGSDSSDEDYRLAPSKVRNTGLCSTCTSVLIFILLVACLLVCTGLTWMHVEMKKDLEILRKDLQAVEIRSAKSSEDVDKISPNVLTINKTLQHVISDIVTVNNTVTQVSGTIAKLSKSLDAAPELKELPGKLQSVSKVLADLGSDVSGMKDTIDSVPPFVKSTSDTLEDLKKQMLEMREKANKESSEGREHGSATPDLDNFMQVITQQVQEMNSTMSAEVSVLMKASTKHEERLAELENTSNLLRANLSNLSTHSSSNVPPSPDGSTVNTDYSSDQFHQSVTTIAQEVLSSESQSYKVDAVMANITKVLDSLNELKDKYEDLETHSKTVTGETTPGSYVTVQMFNTLQEEVSDQITTLNTSFFTLKLDVKTMSQLLTRHSNSITNLTYQFDATQSYLKQKLGGGSNIPPAVKEEQPSQAPTANTSPVKTDVTTAQPIQNQESSTSKTTIAPPQKIEEIPGTISVDRIKSFDDLELNFSRWDMKGTGVHYEDLSGFLGAETPDENDLKAFDENGDGVYSLAEFAKAFGFDMPTTVKPTEHAPPR